MFIDMDYYTFCLSREDAQTVVECLRDHAYQLHTDGGKACRQEYREYAEFLWSQSALHHDLADLFEYKLP